MLPGGQIAVVIPLDEPGIRDALEWLTATNIRYLLANPHTPRLHESGVVFRNEPRGLPDTAAWEERFNCIPRALQFMWADCDDLAPWRAAELRLQGIPCVAEPYWTGSSYHCVVTFPDSTFEDPSRDLWELENGAR